jgi:integrase
MSSLIGSELPGKIRARGNKWQVDAYIDGQRIRRSAGTKTEAKAILEDLQRAAARANTELVLLSDLFRRYVHSLRRRAKPNSVNQADFHVRNLEAHFGAVFPVSELTEVRLDDFIEARRKTGVRDTSINGDLRALRAALRLGIRDREVPLSELPCQVKLLRVSKKKPTILSRDEIEQVIAHARPPYDIIAMLAGYTGLRHREILHLQRRDVDFHSGLLHVTEKPEIWSPKDHEERSIPLAPRVIEPLERHLAGLMDPTAEAWLFLRLEGEGPLRDAFKPIKQAFEAVGLYSKERRSGLHMLRRSFACLAIQNVDLITVKELLGHEKVDTTMLYVTSSDDRKRAAVESLI